MATTPPCEKPAIMIFSVGTPLSSASLISVLILDADSRIPFSSIFASRSSAYMSYHAGITKLLLIVTGIEGACGKMYHIDKEGSIFRKGTIDSKSCPFAPSPCSQMTQPFGGVSGKISTQAFDSIIILWVNVKV